MTFFTAGYVSGSSEWGMYWAKVLNQFWLELLVLVLFASAYLVLRFVILRRKLTYKEFEVFCFLLIGGAILALLLVYR